MMTFKLLEQRVRDRATRRKINTVNQRLLTKFINPLHKAQQETTTNATPSTPIIYQSASSASSHNGNQTKKSISQPTNVAPQQMKLSHVNDVISRSNDSQINNIPPPIITEVPPFYEEWRPPHELPTLQDSSAFNTLIISNTVIQNLPIYTAGRPDKIIATSTANTAISITVQGLWELISHNSQIYHELIILSLEGLCKTYGGHYLDPSFFTSLRDHNWAYIANRFAPPQLASMTRPTLMANRIAIPVHIYGNHWVALCRQVIDGKVTFMYSDDLNNSNTEATIKGLLYSSKVSRVFCPKSSIWINWKTINYFPH